MWRVTRPEILGLHFNVVLNNVSFEKPFMIIHISTATSPGQGTVRWCKKERTCAGATLRPPSVPDDGPDEQYPVRDLDAI